MGWSIGYDQRWWRDIGYGVPAVCDHPGCDAQIDRGLVFVCANQEPFGGEHGCGLYFCSEHLSSWFSDDDPDGERGPQCERCGNGDDLPFTLKPDVPEWIEHKETHPSWAQWRAERDARGEKPRQQYFCREYFTVSELNAEREQRRQTDGDGFSET